MRPFACYCLAGLVTLVAGCATQKTITVQTRPEATIKVDGVEKGRGTVTDVFIWKDAGEVHKVSASRLGYKDANFNLTRDYDKDTLLLTLPPQSKKVTVLVQPVPALVTIDGQQVSAEPTDRLSRELEFTVDARGAWNTHTISAERPGFQKTEAVVRFTDPDANYVLNLSPQVKDLNITTDPKGASVFLDGESLGKTPVTVPNRPFRVNTSTNEWIPQKLKLVKAGYDPIERSISWEEGKGDYAIALIPKTKTVRIVSNPSNAAVVVDGGPEAKVDPSGAAVVTLPFPPTNEAGDLRTYDVTVSKKTATAEWYPQKLTIGWDEGKSDYPVTLKEIITRPVPLVRIVPERGDDGWQMVPEQITTIAMKDVTEGPNKESPVQLLRVGRSEYIDSLTISPDGSQILYSVIIKTDRNDPRSQIRSIRIEASGAESQITDGKSLELMPSYSPEGSQILFCSNRAGKSLSIWKMSSRGEPGMTQLTSGDTNDLWPSIDADAKPRLYYQRMVNTRPDPRLYMTQVDTTTRTDLTTTSGTQPRISPKGDTVLFCHMNDKTGKRDIYRMSDKGGTPENLSNTPEADEGDPAWNRDGTKIAFTSDRGVNEERQHHYGIWMIDLTRPEQPVQVTTNGSWDDCPVWDPSGNFVYFRSNRGGEWGIWRVSVK